MKGSESDFHKSVHSLEHYTLDRPFQILVGEKCYMGLTLMVCVITCPVVYSGTLLAEQIPLIQI